VQKLPLNKRKIAIQKAKIKCEFSRQAQKSRAPELKVLQERLALVSAREPGKGWSWDLFLNKTGGTLATFTS
jgi:hypothetical protein